MNIVSQPNRRLLTLLLVSTMTAMAGTTIAPALPAIRASFAEVEHADLLVRLALTMPAIFTAVGAPLAGLLIDRFGRRKVLLATMALYGIGGAGGGLVSSLWLLLASRALLGLAVGGVMTAAVTLVADYYSGEKRSAVMGQQMAFISAGGVLFLVLGGALADVSWRAPFGIYLLAFAYLPLALLYLPEPHPTVLDGVGLGVASGNVDRPAIPTPWGLIGLVFALALVVMLVFYMTPVHVPFYLERLERGSGTLIGVAIAASTLTGAFSSLVYRRVKGLIGYQGGFGMGFALMGLGYALVALARGFALVTVGLGIFGLGFGLLMPNINNWAGDIAPPAARGKVISGVTTFFFVGQFSSPIVTQPLVDGVGLAGAFGVAAGVVGALAVLFAGWSMFARRSKGPGRPTTAGALSDPR